MTSCLDRTTSSKQRTNDVVAAKRDVVAAKHDVVAAKHDVRDQHSTTSERSKARRRLTCLSLRELFSPPAPLFLGGGGAAEKALEFVFWPGDVGLRGGVMPLIKPP